MTLIFVKAILGILVSTVCVSAMQGMMDGMMGGMMGGMMEGIMHMPHPYSFGYNANDILGNHHRQESGDGSGIVKGSYGYQDAQGLYRSVDYVAGPGMGFQAQVRTNEPGTKGHQNEHPAHVVLQAQPSPHGLMMGGGGGRTMGSGMMKMGRR